MVNVAKYLLLLETIKLPENSAAEVGATTDRLAFNLEILNKFLGSDLKASIKEITIALEVPQLVHKIALKESDIELAYVVQLQRTILTVVQNVNFASNAKEDLTSTRHMNLCIAGVQDLATYALQRQLHPLLCQKGVFSNSQSSYQQTACDLLQLSIQFFNYILQIKQLHVANSMDDVLRYYMAAIYTLFLSHHCHEWLSDESTLQELQTALNRIWEGVSKVAYFRNILLLKSLTELPVELQKQLHQELLQKLAAKDGFTTLVATMQMSQQGSDGMDNKTVQIVANIVAFRGHTKRFQHNMIEQIFKFLRLCLRNEAMNESMGAGLLTLRRLFALSADNQALIRHILYTAVQKLCQPEDLLTGLIVMEHHELCSLIALLYHLFCTSIVECLPSELLIAYLPMLLQLYYHMPPKLPQKQQIASLLTRCLNNRSELELQDIVNRLYKLDFSTAEWHGLHKRLLLVPNAEQTEVTLKVASADFEQDCSISLALPELLMNTDFHPLTYRVFMVLLRMISQLLTEPNANANDNAGIDLLESEDDLIAFLHSKYPVKVELLLSLNTLISHQPLKSQISENYKNFLEFLRTCIEDRVSNIVASKTNSNHSESHDQVLLLLLTLTQELLDRLHSQFEANFRDFIPTLRHLQQLTPNRLVKQRIDILLTLLSGDCKGAVSQNNDAFQQARALIEASESHLQVYGIQMLLDLLRRQDPVALANGHVIIALAFTTLKSKESYTFLNCVRLFVVLLNVMETEVLELLTDEYLSETAPMDFRLVLGEAILKVSQELGPLSYKYKDVLLNCFMSGARSPLNEFRMSAFANLAQLCRTLSYQVHRFFQELLQLIDCELTTGSYLPARRAAVLVLSDLLEGMDNLLDFEEMLLPIYRLLKVIVATEGADTQIRLHASNGLQALNEKCKKLLLAANNAPLQKHIRITGIKDKPKRNLNSHILELN